MAEETGAPEFSAWVLARRAALLRTAWLLTGDMGRAEDLVQTALVRCWPRWGRICGMADIDGYVRRVMTTTYLSWWRRRWRGEVPTEPLPDVASPDPSDHPGDWSALLPALRRLPRGQRAVVVLRFAEDLSVEQTADLLGCSVGTVKSQTSRALTALRADRTLLTEGDPL